MSLEQTNALIDHLDKGFTADPGPVSPEAAAEMQRRIAEDEETAREWSYLQLAVSTVQDAGLREQVATVRKQWEARTTEHQMQADETQETAIRETAIRETAIRENAIRENAIRETAILETAIRETARPSAEKPAGLVRNLYRNVMRVAACAVLIAGGACIFKYVRLSSSSLYSEYYTAYELNTSRGAATSDVMEEAYAGKNWPAVLSNFSTGKGRSNKTDFLAGIADLELKKFDDAIAHFEQVIATNSQSGGDYFEDEAEYYLAISWLAKNKVNEAMPILEKIRADKSHLYHEKVKKMSFTDLRLVQYKENK
jgi:tetratricopeptide (TPR) repeat protein